jgi:hypothetical protein
MNTTKSSEESADKEADAEDDKRCKATYIVMRQQIQATSSARSRRARSRKALVPRARTGGLSVIAIQEAIQAHGLAMASSHVKAMQVEACMNPDGIIEVEACTSPDCIMSSPKKRRCKRDKVISRRSDEEHDQSNLGGHT